jgi:hypothetical protein
VSARVAGEEMRTPSRYSAAWTTLSTSGGSADAGSAAGGGVLDDGGCGGVSARRQADLRAFAFAFSGRARRSDMRLPPGSCLLPE